MNKYVDIECNFLDIYGGIGVSTSNIADANILDSEVVTADSIGNQIKRFHDVSRPLIVSLNSPGGYVEVGVEIYQMLLDYPGSVTVCIEVIAASTGSLIAMAADTVIMRFGSVMMIHDPSVNTFGKIDDHQRAINALEATSSAVSDIYHTKTNIPKKHILKMMQDETWMAAEEAVKLGFADISEGKMTETLPEFNYGMYQNTPNAVMTYHSNFVFPDDLASDLQQGNKNMSTKPASPPPVKSVKTPAILEDKQVLNGFDLLQYIQENASHAGVTADKQLKIADTLMSKKGGVSVEEVRSEILNTMMTPNDAPKPFYTDSFNMHQGEEARMGKVLSSVMFHKLTGKSPKDEEVRSYMGLDETGITDTYLSARGLTPSRMSQAAKMKALFAPSMSANPFHTASDFPGLTADVVQKTILEGYHSEITPLWSIVSEIIYNGYFENHSISLGGLGELSLVTEDAEIKFGTRGEEVEKSNAEAYAKRFSMSEKLWMMGGMNSLSDFSRDASSSAAQTANKLIVQNLSSNNGNGGVLADGKTLFHPDRANLAETGSAITVEALSVGRKFIRLTKGIDDDTPIGLAPKFLVVGPEKETEAEKILAELKVATASEVNPFSNKLELLVESRLEGNGWYLFADPRKAPVIGAGYMDGVSGPQVEENENFSKLGFEYRVVLRFGAGLRGWRGCWFNPGEN